MCYFYYCITFTYGIFDKDYSVTELKNNFNQKQIEIYELKDYFNSIVPDNYLVEIEFENKKTLNRFEIRNIDLNEQIFLDWNLKVNTNKVDSIIDILNWNRKTLTTIKEKLDNANCIGIQNGKSSRIRFQRSGMGMYSFIVFDEAISDNLKSELNNGCTYILVNDTLVLKYGGGVFGPQCFYNKD